MTVPLTVTSDFTGDPLTCLMGKVLAGGGLEISSASV